MTSPNQEMEVLDKFVLNVEERMVSVSSTPAPEEVTMVAVRDQVK